MFGNIKTISYAFGVRVFHKMCFCTLFVCTSNACSRRMKYGTLCQTNRWLIRCTDKKPQSETATSTSLCWRNIVVKNTRGNVQHTHASRFVIAVCILMLILRIKVHDRRFAPPQTAQRLAPRTLQLPSNPSAQFDGTRTRQHFRKLHILFGVGWSFPATNIHRKQLRNVLNSNER